MSFVLMKEKLEEAQTINGEEWNIGHANIVKNPI